MKTPTLLAARSRDMDPQMKANVVGAAGDLHAAEEALKPLTALFHRLDLLHGRPFQRGLFELGHRRKARGCGLLRGLLVHERYVMSVCFGRPLPAAYLGYYLLTFPPDRAGPVPPEGSVNGPTEGCVRFPLTGPLTVR